MKRSNRNHSIQKSPLPYGRKRANPVPPVPCGVSTITQKKPVPIVDLKPVKEEIKTEIVEETSTPETYENNVEREAFKSEVERFIEISKYFSSPLRKTASYLSENTLVSYPSSFRVEYKRGGVTTEHIKFCNLVLEPIYVKLFKVIPDLEQIKFINMTLPRCKRIPPGLSFNLGFVYDDFNEKPAQNAKIIFVASRKTTTPCYQICEIELLIDVIKNRRGGRELYGSDAIGYVQLRHESGVCTLKCEICPEHKVKASSYNVTMVIDENKEETVSCQCLDCAASAGGCKHAVAFLLWSHRRSKEPSCTEVECYWKKSKLSRVGTTLKYITVQQLCNKEVFNNIFATV